MKNLVVIRLVHTNSCRLLSRTINNKIINSIYIKEDKAISYDPNNPAKQLYIQENPTS